MSRYDDTFFPPPYRRTISRSLSRRIAASVAWALLLLTAGCLALVSFAGCRPLPPHPVPPSRHTLTVLVQRSGQPVDGALVDSIAGTPPGPYGSTNAAGLLAIPNLEDQDFSICATAPYSPRACTGVVLRADQQATVTLDPIPEPPDANLRGQFVVPCPGCPYGPRPGAQDNVFFLAELDTIYFENRALAQQILDRYKAAGGNHLPVNTAVAGGYHNQYPAHNYVGRGADYAAYVEWVQRQGVRASVWTLPDVAPYYDSRARTFDWAAIDRDLTPIYTQPYLQAHVTRAVYMWEDWQRSAEMQRGFDYLSRLWPHARRAYHNPPGHMWPCAGDENEEQCVRAAVAHGMTDLYYQAWPPSTDPIPGHPVGPPIEQLQYDLWDGWRRFAHVDSPWAPIPVPPGVTLRVEWAEGTAYSIYNEGWPTSIGASWCAAALATKGGGITECLDGLP